MARLTATKATRLLFLTDTHLGGVPEGFWQQPRRPDLLEPLVERLRQWMRKHPVDAVLHGGDMTDHGSDEEIALAVALFGRLPAPVYLALGNHDLIGRGSFARWQATADAWFAGNGEAFGVGFPHAGVFVLNHDWHDRRVPFHWDPTLSQRPVVLDRQRQRLEAFARHTPLPVLLVTHAPLHAIPTAQTGLEEAIHRPSRAFVADMMSLAQRHPNVVLALSGHNHVNTFTRDDALASMSTASFIEPSFDVRLITIDTATLSVETISLADEISTPYQFDADRAWTIGSIRDRQCTIRLK